MVCGPPESLLGPDNGTIERIVCPCCQQNTHMRHKYTHTTVFVIIVVAVAVVVVVVDFSSLA